MEQCTNVLNNHTVVVLSNTIVLGCVMDGELLLGTTHLEVQDEFLPLVLTTSI